MHTPKRKVNQVPKAQASEGAWGYVPSGKFYFKGLRNAISHIFQGKVKK